MHDYALSHLSDSALLRDLAALVARDRLTTATLLAHIAEVDARRLYVPAGYPSMFAYCVDELRLSEDAASKRIQAARAARRFPVLFEALAEGRVHLTGVGLLAPHLTLENASELIEAASHRRKVEIEAWLARRFPLPEGRQEARAVVRAIPARPQHAPAHVAGEGAPMDDLLTPEQVVTNGNPSSLAPGDAETGGGLGEHAPAHVECPKAGAPERYLVQVTIAKCTHDKLRYAQALLSHAVPAGDVAQVLDRALEALIVQLERRKFGAIALQGRRPRAATRRPSSPAGARYIPAPVRRAVWERDGGRCTFVGASGTRCGARHVLEFDHVEPVARGGRATVDGIRLRCRAHNQYEAERAFGAGFMSRRRHEARIAAAESKARLAEAGPRAQAAESRARAAAKEQSQDVFAGLRSLGCRADEARRAAEFSESLQGATLEERMRAALEFLGRRAIPGREGVHHGRAAKATPVPS